MNYERGGAMLLRADELPSLIVRELGRLGASAKTIDPLAGQRGKSLLGEVMFTEVLVLYDRWRRRWLVVDGSLRDNRTAIVVEVPLDINPDPLEFVLSSVAKALRIGVSSEGRLIVGVDRTVRRSVAPSLYQGMLFYSTIRDQKTLYYPDIIPHIVNAISERMFR